VPTIAEIRKELSMIRRIRIEEDEERLREVIKRELTNGRLENFSRYYLYITLRNNSFYIRRDRM